MKKIVLIAAIIALTSSYASAQIAWNVDPVHSKIQFTATHMLISEVTGEFKKFDGKISSADDDFNNASIEFTVDVNSISTNNEMRDNHLKSDDFFNAEKFPGITFKSKSLRKTEGNNYILTGDLTIRDVTKSVEIPVIFNGKVTDGYGNLRAGFKAAGSINRLDYGLKWNKLLEAGGATVSKDILFTINIELIKQKGT